MVQFEVGGGDGLTLNHCEADRLTLNHLDRKGLMLNQFGHMV